ncbi:PEP-CTERM sorting domain-containing protein [Deefgea sp. CFH1-16]|uniref:PEP-CTERM sorting domain-containing protein n=1 Tax=Deefgea sp. CFH1-16 TaxID=2675457 RepID=UPI0015F4B44A|nr:PEP-CTERM sorting domain-containing protein [Deefgea sp. CFH1-16]MBM5573380.1 PEP-CTERM sorting domain-containing protein [Deefgea sp. CFH1-16]
MSTVFLNFKKIRYIFICASMGMVASHAHANLINGGSFNDLAGCNPCGSSATGVEVGSRVGTPGYGNWAVSLPAAGNPEGFTWSFVTNAAASNNKTMSAWSYGGLNSTITSSPDGGNFYIANPIWGSSVLSQSFSGLTVGAGYDLSFYQAGAQQQGWASATTHSWDVTFGNQTQSSTTLNTTPGVFSGWSAVNMHFTATAANQTLSFLVAGGPVGQPPYSLLDGVTLVPTAPVPEPATVLLMMAGVGGLLARRKLRTQH